MAEDARRGMTDQVLGAVGLGLVWGWWLVLVVTPAQVLTLRAALLLASSSLIVAAGIALLADAQSLLEAVLASALAAAGHLAFKGAIRQQRRSFDA